MTMHGALVAMALTVAFASPSVAQNSAAPPGQPAHPEQSTTPQANDAGTRPEGLGSTGWGGGSRGQSKPSTAGSARGADEASAADQPLMATGVDLNGPPTRFPANKTPE